MSIKPEKLEELAKDGDYLVIEISAETMNKLIALKKKELIERAGYRMTAEKKDRDLEKAEEIVFINQKPIGRMDEKNLVKDIAKALRQVREECANIAHNFSLEVSDEEAGLCESIAEAIMIGK